MDLTGPTVALVGAALRRLVASELVAARAEGAGRLVGVSCLAPGADTLFAESVLESGGGLVAVLPAGDYRRVLGRRETEPGRRRVLLERFDRLVSAAEEVVRMPFESSGERAYEAANAELLTRADLLVAVWDGVDTGLDGGTAHTVAEARVRRVPVRVVWPPLAERASRASRASRAGSAPATRRPGADGD